jgi:hypothetical protein
MSLQDFWTLAIKPGSFSLAGIDLLCPARRDYMAFLRQFRIKLGLGRMASNHPKTYVVEGKTQSEAAMCARMKYHEEVGKEIGERNPIWGKLLTIESVQEVGT